ncbi:phosphoribosyl-AMP cyclohydrolase [Coralliovum pocilloporae]|uniref:phosphoribosyl-AMP cyclohydrolase n=1 Tax=Coralliovum pocilloporae TaxID=3066369 RepID=UPI003307B1DB
MLEDGKELAPRFDENGLIPCITTHAETGDLLMVGYMNADSLAKSIECGEAVYWSRSRQELWKKGETSGQTQKIVEMRTDCDQDAIWIKVLVEGNGATCHVGYHSCFYRSVELGEAGAKPPALKFEETSKVYDPDEVYGRKS